MVEVAPRRQVGRQTPPRWLDQRSTSERRRDHLRAVRARPGPQCPASGAIRTWRLTVCGSRRAARPFQLCRGIPLDCLCANSAFEAH